MVALSITASWSVPIKLGRTLSSNSVPKSSEERLDKFSHKNIKILETTYHTNKIRVGHLKGNKFFIRLKRVNLIDSRKIQEAVQKIATLGMPNYFGYQRFGNDGNNHIDGEKIAKGEKKERNPKIRKLLINSYQSYLFNMWLSRRLEINTLLSSFKSSELESLLNMSGATIKKLQAQKHPFKILQGDIMEHYPHGRLFEFEGSDDESLKRGDVFTVSTFAPGYRVKVTGTSEGKGFCFNSSSLFQILCRNSLSAFLRNFSG